MSCYIWKRLICINLVKMLVFVLVAIAAFGLSAGIPLDPPAIPNSRIHGGVDAPKGAAPHMAALLYGSLRVRVVCGASIIGRTHLLTAAHCVEPFVTQNQLSPPFHGRVGSNIWHSGGTIIQFQSQYIHPEWNRNIIKHDIALLELTKELDLNDDVAVIGLDFGWVGGGEPCYVTGWGTMPPRFDDDAVHLAPTPEWLQYIELSTLSPNECYKLLHSYPTWSVMAPPLNESLEICTFHSVGHGLCHGDSGSALVSIRTGLLIGVVSWGMPSCAAGAPEFYSRIMAFKEWITSIMGSGL